jgi:hypothetical protein
LSIEHEAGMIYPSNAGWLGRVTRQTYLVETDGTRETG